MERQLVLHVRRLVEPLIVIDAERQSRLADRGPGSGNLRRKEASGNRRHHDERRDVMEVRHIGAQREARDLRVVPVDREGDRSIAQNAEVERVMRVLPDVFAAEHHIFSESLLQAGMELVAKAGLQRALHAGVQESRGDNTSLAQPWLESTRFSLNGVSSVRA